MKVTAIQAQKRRPDRYSIFIDNKYSFSLPLASLTDAGLRIGLEVTDRQVGDLIQESEDSKVLDKVYNFLSYRLRSRAEIVTYLRRKSCPEEQIEHLIGILEKQDFIDDHRFAVQWVENRQLLSPRSNRELTAELRQKGISSEIIAEVLPSASDEADAEVIKQLINQKRLLQKYDDPRKLQRYLAGKGFSYTSILRALDNDSVED